MAKWSGILFLAALLVLCCAGVALASEDPLIDDYMKAFSFGPVIETLMWSVAYLFIYAGGLIIPQHYMQRFNGFELSLLLWVAVLWLGGMSANFAGYAVVNHYGDASHGGGRWLAVLIAAVLIFGWCVLLAQLPWADLTLKESLLIAGIVTVLCAPYFGSTWKFEKAKPADEESRVQMIQIVQINNTPFTLEWMGGGSKG